MTPNTHTSLLSYYFRPCLNCTVFYCRLRCVNMALKDLFLTLSHVNYNYIPSCIHLKVALSLSASSVLDGVLLYVRSRINTTEWTKEIYLVQLLSFSLLYLCRQLLVLSFMCIFGWTWKSLYDTSLNLKMSIFVWSVDADQMLHLCASSYLI